MKEILLRGHHLINIFYYLKWDRPQQPTRQGNEKYDKVLAGPNIKLTDKKDSICSPCTLSKEQKNKFCENEKLSQTDREVIQRLDLELGGIYPIDFIINRLNEYKEKFN